MIKIVISGCCGRMGSRIVTLAKEDKALEITGALETFAHPSQGKDIGEVLGLGTIGAEITSDLDSALKGCDCLIEFTTPLATIEHLKGAKAHKKAIVIGTTGLTAKEQDEVKEAAKVVPIVMAPNMSIGVNVLFAIAGEVAEKLGPGYQTEIVEAHHMHKKDSPSGTAKKIAEVIAQAKGKALEGVAVYGRSGTGLERPSEEIGIHAVRAGDIVGEHTVMFCGPGERLELTHRAHSRDTFASGALRAAKFIVKAKPGLYGMKEVLSA